MFRSTISAGKRRPGVAEPLSAFAIGSLVLTVLNLSGHVHRGLEADRAANEFRANATQVADGMREILKTKYDRMRHDGQLTEAEYSLAIHRINQDSADDFLRRAADELANRQAGLFDDELGRAGWSVFMSSAFSGIGAMAGHYGGSGDTIVRGIRDSRVLENATDFISGTDGALSTIKLATGPSHLLQPSDIAGAINQAEQRIQGGGGNASDDAQALLSQRIHVFFDKWCVDNQVKRYMEDPNHENWVRGSRGQFQERCHAAFEQYIRGDLSQQGWNVPAPGLSSLAWNILTTYKGYRDTFGRDYTGIYTFEAAQFGGRGKEATYEFKFDDHRDGTATATLMLPKDVDIQELPKIGLPATREFSFPLTAKIDRYRSRETLFYTDGRELHTVVVAIVKFGVRLGEALTSIFSGGGNDEPSLADHAGAENCSLSFRPVSAESDDLTISFSGVLVAPTRSGGGIQTKRQDAKLTARAKRIR